MVSEWVYGLPRIGVGCFGYSTPGAVGAELPIVEPHDMIVRARLVVLFLAWHRGRTIAQVLARRVVFGNSDRIGTCKLLEPSFAVVGSVSVALAPFVVF